MASRWAQKKAAAAEFAAEKELQTRKDEEMDVSVLTRDAAMGKGDDELFEKKLSKEEKKALAKKKRDAKKAAKQKGKKGGGGGGDDDAVEDVAAKMKVLNNSDDAGNAADSNKRSRDDGIDHEASDKLAAEGTFVTYAANRKGVDARSRDINVTNVTLQHMGAILLEETEVVLNHGNRYGLVGRNGCGKSSFLKALGARAIPIPDSIDIFFLKEEIEPSATVTALEAVMSVDDERLKLEARAEELNSLMSAVMDNPEKFEGGEDGEPVKSTEELQEEIMDALNSVYERLDDLDADTAEIRARSILNGLGFTHQMQSKFTKDFSGGWRMRVSLARALFIQPVCLLLDEPTNHLDMEAVIWLENYLSKWKRILLLVSHSQDFLNNVCSNMIHFNAHKKLEYYNGNYDTFIKTKEDLAVNQMKQYKWEQEQIKSMKEYIAINQSKNSKQAESKRKVLQKMERAGLTAKPEVEKMLNFQFSDPGHLPPPVLAFHDVRFGYPNCEPLYTDVNFGVDLDSRIALVGPNGAGKTTLVKLMSGELVPTSGDIRPHGHLKLGRFTQHFVDVLDLEQTPLEFFDTLYPGDPLIEQRKYLGRFGVSGKMQKRKMSELSDGQKSRVVLAKLGRDVPHILLLDEPTNHLDMESIDALAIAVNNFSGGLVLVSHDMRLISQVAKEIWICDNKTIEKYQGDIMNFKMDIRKSQGIEGTTAKLRGDASVKATDKPKQVKVKKPNPKLEVVQPKTETSEPITTISEEKAKPESLPSAEPAKIAVPEGKQYIPLHLRNKQPTESAGEAAPKRTGYIPPHLRNKQSTGSTTGAVPERKQYIPPYRQAIMPYTRKVKRTRDASDKSAATTSSTPLCHLCQSAEPEPVRDSTSYHKSCTPIKNLPKAMSACTTATAITASTNTSSVCSSNMQMPMPMMVQELCPVTGVYANITDDYYISPTIIGKGHYGIVRECIHIATNQSFAVKSIDKSKVGRLDHLQREIFLLANVGHDNIMKLVDCYEDASFLHIITEKYTGGELYDAIIDSTNSHGCLSEQKAGAVIKSLLEAVAYLHDNGVVHRDIKPENILFESKAEDSDVKLIDFGLSRRHQKGESPMTNPVGTAYYMSPELLAKQYDSATDLWSIGVVAYVLLCGFPPFNGRSDGEIMESTRRNRLHFRGSGWMDKSDDAMDFVRCLLRKDPRKRFTAREALMHPWISNM